MIIYVPVTAVLMVFLEKCQGLDLIFFVNVG